MPVTKVRGPVRVGDLSVEMRPALEIERDGDTVTLSGYVAGRRCPGIVKAQAASAYLAYRDATTDTDADGNTVFRYDPLAESARFRSLLLAIVDGLEYDEAEVLAGDTDTAIEILRLLGWWSDDAPAESDSDPEASGENSTGASYSPSSQPSTDSAPENS